MIVYWDLDIDVAPGKYLVAIFSEPYSIKGFPFHKVFSCSLFYVVREKHFTWVLFPLFWLLEAVGEEDRLRHPSLFSFLAQVEPSHVPCLLLHFPIISSSCSTTGFLARTQNALIGTCNVFAHKQIWRETIQVLDSNIKIKRMRLCRYCFHLNMAFLITGWVCVCLYERHSKSFHDKHAAHHVYQ